MWVTTLRDPALWSIVFLTLRVSLSAVALAALVGLPMGALLAWRTFPGRGTCLVLLNTLMGLPPVVAGVVVYLLLSRAGPLGTWGLLFTPRAMMIAQFVLVLPIIAALSCRILQALVEEYAELFASLELPLWRALGTLLWEGRFALSATVLAGFGRAIAEVGAVLIVGGNIAGETRVMTTAIAMETARGELRFALGLGVLLLALALGVNLVLEGLQRLGLRWSATERGAMMYNTIMYNTRTPHPTERSTIEHDTDSHRP